ncbi:MAG: hypothetical protein JRE45_06975 [Deltaproteobacteria bacterium]|nr:hypothetical protein [Deltaproteobacteria bacterium]MBW1874713.1 hypothetical protein [Deltaproteobacteria bacterium]MBW2162048.1 hypothetical protein [Deltaproteobacteria bacterium]MBW2214472.1 hypothetical protein [Deltaproteobacteria bacterium]MBW2378752.1 hypothetical protein [Deltaproteobacteria bacterium]
MNLDAAARRRYARQLLLGEIGEAGQVRLLEAGFRLGADGDADATAAAVEYLERAGCVADETGALLRVPNPSAVMRFAGSPALREPAAAIMGAFSAVEHLKEVLGIAAARELSSELTLSDEG